VIAAMSDWSFAEDMRPAVPLLKEQPEKTPRGDVWTQIVCFNWPAPGYTQMTLRDCAGDLLIGHGRVYEIPKSDEDGA
jgi:hypothetical protein